MFQVYMEHSVKNIFFALAALAGQIHVLINMHEKFLYKLFLQFIYFFTVFLVSNLNMLKLWFPGYIWGF